MILCTQYIKSSYKHSRLNATRYFPYCFREAPEQLHFSEALEPNAFQSSRLKNIPLEYYSIRIL